MAAISSEQKFAFFRKVENADRRAKSSSSKLPSLAPVTPTVKEDQRGNLDHRQRTYKNLYRQRTVLELHVESRQKQLHQLNPVIFHYLNNHQRKALIEELEETRDLLYRTLYMEAAENQHNRILDLDNDAETCQNYIDWIRTDTKPEGISNSPESIVPSWAKGLIGSKLLFPIYLRLMALKNDPIDMSLVAMNHVNNLRLYWVWGNSLIDVLFTLCKEFDLINLDIFNQLEDELKWPAPITGNLSWSLYYLRFLLRVYVCLRPILPGVSEEQKGVSTFERLITTINQHKFNLLNDIFWGTVNLACYAWLTYRKDASLGYAGDLLTAGFLIMDWILTFLDYIENQKKYYKNCSSLEADIEYIEGLLLNANDELEKNTLKLKLVNAKQRLADYQFDFVFTNIELVNAMVYSTLLMLSFPLLIGMISSASLPISAGIILTGAVLCFAVTVIFQAVNNLIPVIKACSHRSRLHKHHHQLLELIQQTEDINQQKIIMIQMDDLQQLIDFRKKQATFQSILFLRSLTIDILFPVLVFVALFSMPSGMGIGMISAGLFLAIASKWYINRFEPTEPNKVEMNDDQLNERIDQVLQQLPGQAHTDDEKNGHQHASRRKADQESIKESDTAFQAPLFFPA